MRLTARLLVFALVSACDAATDAPSARSSATVSLSSNVPPADVVARVGPIAISSAFVGQIAVSQGLDARGATDRATADALFALEAYERGLAADMGRIDSANLARALNRDLTAEARAKGPLTDEELAHFTELHAYELARPPAWLTVHSLVKLDAKSTEADVVRAKEVSQALEAAVRPVASEATGTTSVEDITQDPAVKRFLEVANAIDKKGATVLNQALPGVAADGKTIAPGQPRQPFDPEFVKAALSLQKRGDVVSVRSNFGYHVIMLVDRRPERVLPADERRTILFDEAVANRKRALEDALLAQLSQETPVVVERNVDAVLDLLQVSP